MLLLPKTIGPLTLLRKLGSGGVTETYSGRLDSAGGRPVVARRVLPYVLQDPGRRAAVQVRIRDLLTVRHPFLVQALEYVEDGDERFLVEEAIDAIDLERMTTWCRHHDLTLPPAIFLHITTQMCNALEALHGRPGKASGADHLLHLGLVPSQIYLSHDGKIVVGGVALTRSPTTVPQGGLSGPVPSRMEYLSPEQTHPDQRLTPASDVFSLAAILYELLTLEPLFRDASNHRTINNIRRAEVSEPMRRVKERLPGLEKVLARALSLNPKHRYQRAFVLREDLRGLMAGYTFADIARETADFLRPMFEGSLAVRPMDQALPAVVGDDDDEPYVGFDDDVPTRIEETPLANPEAPTERASMEQLGPLLTEESDEYELFGGPLPDFNVDEDDGPADLDPVEGVYEDDDEDLAPPTRPASRAPWLPDALPVAPVPRPSLAQAGPTIIPTFDEPEEDEAPRFEAYEPRVATRWQPGLSDNAPSDSPPPPNATWPPPEPEQPAVKEPMGQSPSTGWHRIGGAPPAPVQEPWRAQPSTPTDVELDDTIPPPQPVGIEFDDTVPPPEPPPVPQLAPQLAPPPPVFTPRPPPRRAEPNSEAPTAPGQPPAFEPVLAPLAATPPAEDWAAADEAAANDAEPKERSGGSMGMIVGGVVALVLVLGCAGVAWMAADRFSGDGPDGAPLAEGDGAPDAPVVASRTDAAEAAPRSEAARGEAPPVMPDEPVEAGSEPAETAPAETAPAETAPAETARAAEAARATETPRATEPARAAERSSAASSAPPRQGAASTSPAPKTGGASAGSTGRSAGPSAARSAPETTAAEPALAELDLNEDTAPPPGINLDGFAASARAGALTPSDVSTLEAVSSAAPEYTRARSMLLSDAEKRGDTRAARRYLDDLMQLPENRYNAVYLSKEAVLLVNQKKYADALSQANTAERYWGRIPPELVWSTKADIFEVQAAATQGLFYASEDDLDLLEQAIRGWQKLEEHAAGRDAALASRANAQVKRLEDVRRRLQ